MSFVSYFDCIDCCIRVCGWSLLAIEARPCHLLIVCIFSQFSVCHVGVLAVLVYITLFGLYSHITGSLARSCVYEWTLNMSDSEGHSDDDGKGQTQAYKMTDVSTMQSAKTKAPAAATGPQGPIRNQTPLSKGRA